MARKPTLNRKELRDANDAAERIKKTAVESGDDAKPAKVKKAPAKRKSRAKVAKEVRLNESLIVVVKDDEDWIGAANTKNIVLFLNGRPVPKLPIRLETKTNRVRSFISHQGNTTNRKVQQAAVELD